MTIGQAIKQGVAVTHRSWALIGTLVALSILLGVTVMGVALLVGAGLFRVREGVAIAATLLAGTIVVLVSVYFNGGVLGYLQQQLRTGQARIAQFWAAGAQFFGRLLGQAMLIMLIGFGVLIIGGLVLAVGFVAAARIERMTLAIAAPLALVSSLPLALGLYGFILLSFAPIILVFDGSGVVQALGRSVRFMRSHLGQLFVLMLVFIGLYLGTSFVTELASRVVSTAVKATALRVVLVLIVTMINICLGAYLNLLTAAAVTSFYAGTKDVSTSASTDIPAPS